MVVARYLISGLVHTTQALHELSRPDMENIVRVCVRVCLCLPGNSPSRSTCDDLLPKGAKKKTLSMNI